MDRQQLDTYELNAIGNALPGFSSWLEKHSLGNVPLFQMDRETITRLMAKFLKMYEREMGAILDPSAPKQTELGDELNDEIPF